MTIRLSTDSRIALIPTSACVARMLPSKENGEVMIPTVRMPMSLAAFAITGAAPVPVPPPIPAVTKHIFVPFSSIFVISAMLSCAARWPISGSAPAPNPSVREAPSCTLLGTGLWYKACASVLHTMKSTPLTPTWVMWLTAFEPPPPTPITLITELRFLGRLN